MVHKMKDLLTQQAMENFIGRTEEMEFLLQVLKQESPVVAHIHGIGGIGKSILLEVFAEEARKRGATVVRLDCRSIEPTEKGFLHRLDAAIGGDHTTPEDAAGRLGQLGERVVLALDTYEVFRLMDTWLRQVFVPALGKNVRVFLFGREPPVSSWLVAPGWQGLFESIRLESLTDKEAIELLLRFSVKEDVARSINHFAHGHPLALKLAAVALKERPSLNLEEIVTQHVVEELIRLFISDVQDPLTREILDAASVIRRTTRSLLYAMLPHAAPQDAFERLRAFPFVESGRDGLIVHDAVRQAIASSLKAADPNRYRLFRQAAWSQLRQEMSAAGKSELWRYTADLLYMIENPIVREAFFPSDLQPYAVEPAKPEDMGDIHTITDQNDGSQAAALVEWWWKQLPNAFNAVRDRNGAVSGYYYMFNPETVKRSLLKEDPVIWSWWEHLQEDPIPKKQQALFIRRWLGREMGEAPSPVQAACWLDIKRTYIEQRLYLRRVYVTVQDPGPYVPVLQTLGFNVLEHIDVQLDGKQCFSAVLDFGSSLVGGWLSSLVDAEIGIEPDDFFDMEARELIIDGQRVGLTPLEFEVMNYLYQRDGKVCTRTSLLDEVWGYKYEGGSNVVDAVIRSLRKKLSEKASLIETVSGMGYRFHKPSSTGKR
ncbi:MAG: winged helix-turn-helix domain-containing protein [Deltaproteobacteria bacterium]|nr:winged helix-turn-helix domain-containing protein [Deltaproteobacteria bacterium]